MNKPHVSPSQIGLASRCGEAYRRRYIEGEIIPPGIAAHAGTGVHEGAAENFRQKQFSHEDLPVNQIVDAAVGGFENAMQGRGAVFTPEEESRGVGLVIAKTKDSVAKMAEVHATEQAPDYQPVAESVEQRMRIPLPDETHDLLGIVDLIDEDDKVVDFKTAARRKSQQDADESLQLTFYSLAHELRQSKKPSEVRLDVLVKNKKIARQVVSSTRDANDYTALSHRVNAVLKMKELGLFMPADPGSWQCSAKWCGYFGTCPYVNSERKEKAT